MFFNRKTISITSLFVLLILTILDCRFSTPATTNPESNFFLEGLLSPRGLTTLDDGTVLIAEGGAGRLLKSSLNEQSTVVLDNLPSLAKGPDGLPVGISSALFIDEEFVFVIGEARAKGFREIYQTTFGTDPTGLTGQDPIGINPPNPLTNPYDLVALSPKDFLITDPGSNNVWKVTTDGQLTLYAVIPPIYLAQEDMYVQSVPTGITLGPDDAVYVVTLTGFPFPNGSAQIIRIKDINDDGDAQDAGELVTFATGFTSLTDLTFHPDGGILMTQFSNNLKWLSENAYITPESFPGKLLHYKNGQTKVLAHDLVSPTSVTVLENYVLVSEEFKGRIRIIPLE